MWPPECKAPPFQRQNHHGNDVNGYPASYDWIIPNWLGNPEYEEVVDKKCVLRLAKAYGNRVEKILGPCLSTRDLGIHFGVPCGASPPNSRATHDGRQKTIQDTL